MREHQKAIKFKHNYGRTGRVIFLRKKKKVIVRCVLWRDNCDKRRILGLPKVIICR